MKGFIIIINIICDKFFPVFPIGLSSYYGVCLLMLYVYIAMLMYIHALYYVCCDMWDSSWRSGGMEDNYKMNLGRRSLICWKLKNTIHNVTSNVEFSKLNYWWRIPFGNNSLETQSDTHTHTHYWYYWNAKRHISLFAQHFSLGLIHFYTSLYGSTPTPSPHTH